MREYDLVPSNDRRELERRRRSRLVLREQRSGFDRRCREGGRMALGFERVLLGLRDRPSVVRVVLLTVNVLNVADFLLTLNVLRRGGGEANPIMRSLFELGPAWAGIFKVVAVLLASLLVWRCRSYRPALAAALGMLALFTAVAFYHILGLASLG